MKTAKETNLPTSSTNEDRGMANLIYNRHPSWPTPPSTKHSVNSPGVDAVFCTPFLLDCYSCGYFEFDALPGSDHSNFWFDIQFEKILGIASPMEIVRPEMRRLNLINPKATKKYLKIYLEQIHKHRIPQRQFALEASIIDGVPLTPAQAKEADTIDNLMVQAMLYAEKRCRQLYCMQDQCNTLQNTN